MRVYICNIIVYLYKLISPQHQVPVYKREDIFLQQKHKIEFFALIHWKSLHRLQIIVKLCQNAFAVTSNQGT